LGRITQLDLPESVYDAVVVHFILHDIPTAERPGMVKAILWTKATTTRPIIVARHSWLLGDGSYRLAPAGGTG
jgi:hypothetical protein